MKNSRKISVIVPAYNEEKKIVGVINSLFNSNSFDQIICVNDGSTDNTLQLLKKFKKITLINLKKNHGKGFAVAAGIKKVLSMTEEEYNKMVEKGLARVKLFSWEKTARETLKILESSISI